MRILLPTAAALAILSGIGVALSGCGGEPRSPGERFVIIGDYGCGNLSNYECSPPEEPAGKTVVDQLHPDHIVTVGDNNYGDLTLDGYDQVVGRFYGDHLLGTRPFLTAPGPGRSNHFWPAPGNHDWYAGTDRSDDVYRQYFAEALGTTEHYYEADLGAVHLFSLDSGFLGALGAAGGDPHGTPAEQALDADLRSVGGAQARWLRERLAASTSCFNVVFFHHPPFSSGVYARPELRWPFKAWGADAVVSGHEHFYERLEGGDGMVYFISGMGGAHLFHASRNADLGSRFAFGAPDLGEGLGRHAALLMIADGAAGTLRFELHTLDGETLDPWTLTRDCARARPDAGR